MVLPRNLLEQSLLFPFSCSRSCQISSSPHTTFRFSLFLLCCVSYQRRSKMTLENSPYFFPSATTRCLTSTHLRVSWLVVNFCVLLFCKTLIPFTCPSRQTSTLFNSLSCVPLLGDPTLFSASHNPFCAPFFSSTPAFSTRRCCLLAVILAVLSHLLRFIFASSKRLGITDCKSSRIYTAIPFTTISIYRSKIFSSGSRALLHMCCRLD